ncbi:MAG: GNAT family N-acetyltransferase [Oscillospiraceae bacterium]|nr:GNAT family N-acetyltransferase [Oscillospiraceae bacterium]
MNNFSSVQITDSDIKSSICRVILDALPQWFGIPEAVDDYVQSVKTQPFWAVYVDAIPVGFIAVQEHNPYTAEIDVMGVLPEYQRKGIGRSLIHSVENYCRKIGKMMLLVKTLDFSDSDINYAKTRSFYISTGFVPLQKLEGYWDENNPCLLMAKSINNTVCISTLSLRDISKDNTQLIEWTKTWDWEVGKIIASRVENNNYSENSVAFVLTLNRQYAGLCILEARDEYSMDVDGELTPFITAVYVSKEYRGQRMGEKLLLVACNTARSLGFDSVYLISNERGYYEKYGFTQYTMTNTKSGRVEPVFKKSLL